MNAALDHSGRHILEGEYRNIDVGIARASCKVSHFQNVQTKWENYLVGMPIVFQEKFILLK
jgi:hypothetical protein